MKMTRIISSLIALVVFVALAIFVPGGEARADGTGILGFLTCTKTGPGNTYVLFSKIPLECDYAGVGGPQSYAGIGGILLGVDLELEQKAGMIYAVIGGTSVNPGGLAGDYVGAKASVTLGIGPAVQGGLAGVGSGFELVPLGLGGQIGVGVTGGLAYLQISSVAAPVAAVPPPPPPPAPAAAVPARTFIVFFDFDKSDVKAAGQAIIDTAVALAKENGAAHIQVNGYTDTSGTRAYNVALSQRRADAVRAAFVAGGIKSDRIGTAAYGEDNLRVKTPDGVREAQNRRVEILIGP